LAGYPLLFATKHLFTCSGFYDSNEMDMLNSLAGTMRDAQKATVADAAKATTANPAGIKVSFVDMVAGFHGTGACPDTQLGGGPENLHHVVIGPTGPGDFAQNATPDFHCLPYLNGSLAVCASRESFHPITAGGTLYAQAVAGKLSAIGYHF